MQTLGTPADAGDMPTDIAVGPHDVYVALFSEGRIATFSTGNPHAVRYFTLKPP